MSDTDDDLDDLAREGLASFNDMADAMRGLEGRIGALQAELGALRAGLAAGAAKAEQAAAAASTAAGNAANTAEHVASFARAEARSVASWAVLGALAGVLVAGGAGWWLGHAGGRESGLAEGYRAAADEKAAASWANTPAGQLAFALDKAGSLAMVAGCTNRGWTPAVQDGRRVCYPRADKDGKVYGWVIP